MLHRSVKTLRLLMAAIWLTALVAPLAVTAPLHLQWDKELAYGWDGAASCCTSASVEQCQCGDGCTMEMDGPKACTSLTGLQLSPMIAANTASIPDAGASATPLEHSTTPLSAPRSGIDHPPKSHS